MNTQAVRERLFKALHDLWAGLPATSQWRMLRTFQSMILDEVCAVIIGTRAKRLSKAGKQRLADAEHRMMQTWLREEENGKR